MTISKLFSKAASRLKIISAFALAMSAVVAGILLWGPRRAQADNAPDWLRAAAQDKLPNYPADTVAVILLDEQQTIVKDNGEIETRYRRAYKLLRPEARKEYGGGAVHFYQETKISFFKAWTVMPEGRKNE